MRIKQDLSEKPPGCWNSARKCIEVSEKCRQREKQSKIQCLCSWKGHCKTGVSLSKTTENVHKICDLQAVQTKEMVAFLIEKG